MARYAMMVLCGRQHGLVCSLTRLLHYGPLSDELRRKAEAVAASDRDGPLALIGNRGGGKAVLASGDSGDRPGLGIGPWPLTGSFKGAQHE